MVVDKELARRDDSIVAYLQAIKVFENISKMFPTAIVSGSTRQQIGAVIEEYGLQDNLDFYLGAEDFKQRGFMPECFLQAARLFNVS